MGTRCQIDFINKYQVKASRDSNRMVTRHDRTRVYHHWDGDPANIISQLKKFIKWCDGDVGDVEYITANFIFWCKLDYIHDHNSRTTDPTKIIDLPGALLHRKEVDPTGNLLNSFGVCDVDDLHGDLSYFYEFTSELRAKPGSMPATNEFLVTILCYKMGRGRKLKKLHGLRGQLIKTEQFTIQ